MSELRLAGSAEIGHFLDVSRQRVTQLQREPGFPEPLADLAMGKVYDFNDIERWAIETGRRETFRYYLEAAIADDADRDPDGEIDAEATREQFLSIIEPYGFTLDNAIPATFSVVLDKSF